MELSAVLTAAPEGGYASCILNPAALKHNSIVAEIHAARERLAEEYHNDLVAYSEAAEAHCHALGFRFAESPRRQAMQEVLLQAEARA